MRDEEGVFAVMGCAKEDVINQPCLGINKNGDGWGMVYDCFAHIIVGWIESCASWSPQYRMGLWDKPSTCWTIYATILATAQKMLG